MQLCRPNRLLLPRRVGGRSRFCRVSQGSDVGHCTDLLRLGSRPRGICRLCCCRSFPARGFPWLASTGESVWDVALLPSPCHRLPGSPPHRMSISRKEKPQEVGITLQSACFARRSWDKQRHRKILLAGVVSDRGAPRCIGAIVSAKPPQCRASLRP